MLIGAGEAGRELLHDLSRHPENPTKVHCIIDDDKTKWGTSLHGIPVVGGRESILPSVQRYNIGTIILAIPSASTYAKRDLLKICQQTNCLLKTLPSLSQFVDPYANIRLVRDVNIEDLLGRNPAKIDLSQIARHVEGKTILVTGGGGSIGSELCRQLATFDIKKLIIFDIYENSAYSIQQELLSQIPSVPIETLIGSIRDEARLAAVMEKYRPNIIFHAAAHKHVPLMEASPHEAIKNNVLGTWNLARLATNYEVDNFVLISTDKAVNPTNIMGASKRICEMIIQSYNCHHTTEFVAVRFGNVLGSNGSVIPLFQKQIENGGPVTVTHPDITRYFMTIPEAISLVLLAESSAKGGEIFVLDMGEPVKIATMAEQLIRLSGYVPDRDIAITYSGLRPGEKLYEELLMNEEKLNKTNNEKIFIASPVNFDEDDLFIKLNNLVHLAYDEKSNIRDAIMQIVPTYIAFPSGDN